VSAITADFRQGTHTYDVRLRIDELISEEIRYLDPELNCDPQFLKIRNRKCTRRRYDAKGTLLSHQLISAEIAYLDPEFSDRAAEETNDNDGTSPDANRSFWTASLVVVTILSLACLIIVVEWLSGQLR
jgi:hypothetical protein